MGVLMDVDKLEAGDELDALIAERVMGWTRWRHEDGIVHLHAPEDARWLPRYNAAPTDERFTEWDTSTFKASTDIAAAWTVVEKMRTCGHHFILCDSQVEGWAAEFGQCGPVPTTLRRYAQTAPLAICKAALAVTS